MQAWSTCSAGKSTLLQLLAGKHMVAPDAIRVLGRPAFHDIVSKICLCLALPAPHRPGKHPALSPACPERRALVEVPVFWAR